MSYMMRPSTLTIQVLRSANFTKANYERSAAGTPTLLTSQSQFLGVTRELVESFQRPFFLLIRLLAEHISLFSFPILAGFIIPCDRNSSCFK